MMVEHAFATALPEIQGARALVYSLGIEGRDLARWLIARGASVTMADSRSAEQLDAAGATPPEGVERTVRGKLLDPEGFDLLALSQSVLRSDPHVARARELGIPVVSQLALALRLCRGRVVGITGSSGKSTTTALVGAMAESAGTEHLSGEPRGSLLDRVEDVPETASVILEMSHTQLQYTDRSPTIAAVTNVTPNHLDQFSWLEYVDLKRSILRYQDADGLAILNADDETSRELRSDVRGQVAEVSLAGPVVGDGAWLEGDGICCAGEARRSRGRAATCACGDAQPRQRREAAPSPGDGAPRDAVAERWGASRGFPPPAVVDAHTARSGSTTASDPLRNEPWPPGDRVGSGSPAAGRTRKALTLEPARRRERAVPRDYLFGEAATPFAETMEGRWRRVRVRRCRGGGSGRHARTRGHAVCFSPAGTSFDAYPRFEARGEAFAALVAALDGFEEVSP